MSCPSCSISLVKGDGCNTVTCVCGKQFSWSDELLTTGRCRDFLELFPSPYTDDACVDILCGNIEGSETNALAWRSRNMVATNTGLLKHWTSLYQHCPSQACALKLSNAHSSSRGLRLASELWENGHRSEVTKCSQAIDIARESLFTSLYPNLDPIAQTTKQHRR